MKKHLLAIIVTLCSMLAATAQVSFNSGDNHAYWGARIGLDVSSPSDVHYDNGVSLDVFNSGAGFNFGVVRNMPLVANLYIEPGVLFYYDTFGMGDVVLDDFNTSAKMSFRQFGFRIPVMVGYHIDFTNCNIHLFLGPEFAVGLYGRLHASAKVSGVNVSDSENCYKDGGLNRLNAAFRFGAALEVSRFYVSLSGAFGSNILNDRGNGASSKHQMFTLGIGYNFK